MLQRMRMLMVGDRMRMLAAQNKWKTMTKTEETKLKLKKKKKSRRDDRMIKSRERSCRCCRKW